MTLNERHKIPRPKRLSLSKLMNAADNNKELLTYDSEIGGFGYITDDRDVLILSKTNGTIRIRAEDAKIIAEEMISAAEDVLIKRTFHRKEEEI